MSESGRLSQAPLFDLHRSPLYVRFAEEAKEIDRLKWLESEKAGHDIGNDRAMWIWMTTHRSSWMKAMQASGVQGF